jgi:hypothetical protein
MKTTIILIFVLGLGAAGFWYITENARADRELAYQRQQKELAKKEAEEKEWAAKKREEDERIRKERQAAVAKEDAVRLFLNYIDREENRIKEEIEELKLNIEKLCIDQDSLEDELKAIERANIARVESAKKRKEIHRDKIERVRALLSSVVLNRLSRTYCGEDLSGMRSKFEAEVQKIKEIDDRYHKKLRTNLSKYDETVRGADEKVNDKLKIAREKYRTIQRHMDPERIGRLQAQLKDVEKKIEKILEKKSRTKWDNRDLERLQNQQIVLQNQISNLTGLTGLANANTLHMDATEAETEARRTYDRAGKSLTMDNDMALMERAHEQEIYNMAKRYEERSLDRIRTVIAIKDNGLRERLTQMQRHLGYLGQKAVNIDFLKAEEIEQLRKEIANSMLKSMAEVEAGK